MTIKTQALKNILQAIDQNGKIRNYVTEQDVIAIQDMLKASMIEDVEKWRCDCYVHPHKGEEITCNRCETLEKLKAV